MASITPTKYDVDPSIEANSPLIDINKSNKLKLDLISRK